MCERIRSVRSTALVVVLLGAMCCCSFGGSDYSYIDDFSTDKAMEDSYSHSVFLEELPSAWPDAGFLMYRRGSTYDYLAMYAGVAFDASALLSYSFPLEAGGLISHGIFEFDIVHSDSDWGWIRYWRSYDGSSWEWITTVWQTGHYSFELVPPEPCSHVFLGLWGEHGDDMMLLDNLSVSLTYSTPVERRTWSRIKALYQ